MIFTKFSGLLDILVRLIKRSFILRSFKERCHGNQICRQICELAYLTGIRRTNDPK